MTRDRMHFLFLNIGHFIDHYATLIFATVAALALTRDWGMTYADLAVYGTPGFVAFGLFSYPAGRLGDRWSRDGMMAVFFIGIGLAAILTGFAQTPLQMAIGLFVIGIFAAIYHPVGLAMVVSNYAKSGWALALNGVWGNLGVACAGRGHHEAAWRHPSTTPAALTDIRYFQDLARRAEAACFDSIFLANSLGTPDDVETSGRAWLEPITSLGAIAVVTEHIGLIATASTTYTEPFNLARQFASLDHISNGRIGWNIVTSWLAAAAKNYGDAKQVSHQARYDRAEEFMTVVKGSGTAGPKTRSSTTVHSDATRVATASAQSRIRAPIIR